MFTMSGDAADVIHVSFIAFSLGAGIVAGIAFGYGVSADILRSANTSCCGSDRKCGLHAKSVQKNNSEAGNVVGKTKAVLEKVKATLDELSGSFSYVERQEKLSTTVRAELTSEHRALICKQKDQEMLSTTVRAELTYGHRALICQKNEKMANQEQMIHQQQQQLTKAKVKATHDEVSDSLLYVEDQEILSTTVGAELTSEHRALICKQNEKMAKQERMIYQQQQQLTKQADMIKGLDVKLSLLLQHLQDFNRFNYQKSRDEEVSGNMKKSKLTLHLKGSSVSHSFTHRRID